MKMKIKMELTDTQSNSFPVVVLVRSSSNSRLNLCLNHRRTFWAFWSSLNRNWNRRFRARQLSLLGMSLLCNASTKLCNTHHHFCTLFKLWWKWKMMYQSKLCNRTNPVFTPQSWEREFKVRKITRVNSVCTYGSYHSHSPTFLSVL
jgi:hypothetical protein